MYKLYEKVYNGCLFLIDFFVCIFINILEIKIPLIKREKNNLRKEIHILGNGPSGLKTLPLNIEELVTVNFFINTDKFYKLRPKYHFLIDNVFFDNSNLLKKEINELFENLEKKVNWKLILVVRTKKKIELKNPNITIIYLRMPFLTYTNRITLKMYKYNLATPFFVNVIIAALYFIINKGYKKIYLHGVESDSFKDIKVDLNCNVILEDKHSYGAKSRNLTKEGTIIQKELYKKIESDYLMLYNYYLLSVYSSKAKIDVFNCCENSMIDSFKKIKIEE